MNQWKRIKLILCGYCTQRSCIFVRELLRNNDGTEALKQSNHVKELYNSSNAKVKLHLKDEDILNAT